jgi:hypothetical protein
MKRITRTTVWLIVFTLLLVSDLVLNLIFPQYIDGALCILIIFPGSILVIFLYKIIISLLNTFLFDIPLSFVNVKKIKYRRILKKWLDGEASITGNKTTEKIDNYEYGIIQLAVMAPHLNTSENYKTSVIFKCNSSPEGLDMVRLYVLDNFKYIDQLKLNQMIHIKLHPKTGKIIIPEIIKADLGLE